MLFNLSNNMQTKHMDEFQSNHQSGLFNSPRIVVGLSMENPFINHQFHFFRTQIHGHFRSHNTQSHFHGFLDKEYPSRRKPLHLGVVETPQYQYPCVALAVRINFASCLIGIRRTNYQEIYREMRASHSKNSLPLFGLTFSLLLPFSQPVGRR